MSEKARRPRGTGELFKNTAKGRWIARFYDARGKRVEKSTLTTDRAVAERTLTGWLAEAALIRTGSADPAGVRYRDEERRPLSDHLADFEKAMIAKGSTKKHVALVVQRVKVTAEKMNADRLSKLQPAAASAAIAELRDGGASLYTAHHYLRSMKSFSRWLHRDGRTRNDALKHLSGFNVETDKRYDRRALDADECRFLIDVTTCVANWRGISGAERAIIYRTALGTGFRANELRSLRVSDFTLDGGNPTITLNAASSKHRRADVQPIRTDLADVLRDWLDGKPDNAPAFNVPEKTALMLHADMRRARARWIRGVQDRRERRERRAGDFLRIQANGRVVDFHSLRASYITALVKSGASVKEAQTLARHSDPKLTLNIYTKLGVHDLSEALERLPSMSAEPEIEHVHALREATNDAPVNHPPKSPPKSRGLVRNDANDRDSESKPRVRLAGSENPVSIGENDTMRRGAGRSDEVGKNAPAATRTRNLRIRSPLPETVNTENTTACEGQGEPPPQNDPQSPPKAVLDDPELQRLVDAWHDLPVAIKTAIKALVNATTGAGQ